MIFKPNMRADLAVLVLIPALVLAGCGSTKTSSPVAATAPQAPGAGSSGGRVTNTASGGSCGTIPAQLPADPDGALGKLPQSVKAAFNLYNEPVLASAWTHWRPPHPGPYSVYLNAGLQFPFAQQLLGELSKLKKQSALVKNLVIQDNNASAQTQIQQLQQAIQQRKGDLFVVLPLNATADAPILEAAGRAGIPTVSPLYASVDRYVVGLDGNERLQGADLMQGLASILGDRGSLLEEQGIPGDQATSGPLQGAAVALARCPHIEVAGSPVGGYATSTAKTATLEFLSAHPQPINAVLQVGGMATGIIQAFQQTGRTVPSVGDLGATPGALAYWKAHASSYKAVALALPVPALADATWNVAVDMLSGRGVKTNEILQKPVIVTNENLDQWVEPGWTLTTTLAYAPGPPGVFYSQPYLDEFFNKH